MTPDEQAIRNFFSSWRKASLDGDNETLRKLMAEDVVFLTVGMGAGARREFVDDRGEQGTRLKVKVEG